MQTSIFVTLSTLVLCLCVSLSACVVSDSYTFGRHVKVDLSDPGLDFVCNYPLQNLSTHEMSEEKNSPGSIDLDY